MESGFVSLDPEEEKLLAEIRTDLEGMKKKEAAMEALLQELAASNKITYAAIAAHSGVSVPAAPQCFGTDGIAQVRYTGICGPVKMTAIFEINLCGRCRVNRCIPVKHILFASLVREFVGEKVRILMFLSQGHCYEIQVFIQIDECFLEIPGHSCQP